MQKLISFTIYAEKGFLKKPDINDGIYLTYNMLHKPAILGILGAITGLEGYKQNNILPEYYTIFKDMKIGIRPENHDKGNFQKTIIKYNNTTGLASNEEGGNLIITEQTLIAPAYTIFLLLDFEKYMHKVLYENINKQEAIFLPYLGKNDYSLWWLRDEVKEYEYDKNIETSNFTISTIFKKEESVINYIAKQYGRQGREKEMLEYVYFERLPIGFNETLFQYEMADFAFVNANLEGEGFVKSEYLYFIKSENSIIYLY